MKRVPDDGDSDVEALSAELSPVLKNQHVVTFSKMEMCPTRDISSWHADVFEL